MQPSLLRVRYENASKWVSIVILFLGADILTMWSFDVSNLQACIADILYA